MPNVAELYILAYLTRMEIKGYDKGHISLDYDQDEHMNKVNKNKIISKESIRPFVVPHNF